MITIDDKTYTEEDLDVDQKALVARLQVLQQEADRLQTNLSDTNILMNAYGNALRSSLAEPEESPEEVEH
jgi:hypothetical protein